MKKTIVNYLRGNGFYLSFGLGMVALVVALMIYNYGETKKRRDEVNVEPKELAVESTEELPSPMDADMDVPMDMWKDTSVIPEAHDVVEPSPNPPADIPPATEEEISTEEAVETAGDPLGEPQEALLEDLHFDLEAEYTMPVLGNIILPYSMDTTVYFKTLRQYACNPGVLLQAPVGTLVVSMGHGQVEDIYQSNEYGTVVVVNMGDGYQTYYGQMDELKVQVGDEVYADTVLGSVAVPTAYYQKEGEHLYLAMTKDGEVMNPMDILQNE